MKIVVLGGYGEIGQVISADLSETAKEFEIVIAGREQKKAVELARSFKKRNIKGVGVDARNRVQMGQLLKGASVLINATNYYNNLDVMNAALDAGVHYVDLGGLYHMSLKQLKLDKSFKKKKLTAIIGCGSTPGITNVMAHYGAERLSSVDSIDIQFADKDYTRYDMPFVVPYSMYTVFDEFTKKPAVFEKGKIRFAEPLSGGTEVEFPEPVGIMTCHYSLHSELASIPSRFAYKGLKNCSFRGGWDPDFVEKVKFLIRTGFASTDAATIKGQKIVPRDFTVALMNRFLPPKKAKINDLEYLRVELNGQKNGRNRRIVMLCETFTNKRWNIPAGSWDTGVPASVVAQMLARGEVRGHGVLPPDTASLDPGKFFKELERRGIKISIESEREI